MIEVKSRWVLRAASGWTAIFERNPLHPESEIVYTLNYRGSQVSQHVLGLQEAREEWTRRRKLGFIWIGQPADDF